MKLPHVPLGSRILKKQIPLLKGSDVRHVQQVLKRLGFLNTRVDGVFGYETDRAVKRFQEAFQIKQKGIIDNETLNILEELIKLKPHRWQFTQNLGSYPIPISSQLKISLMRSMPGIISLDSFDDRIIITSANKVSAFSKKDDTLLWENRDINPRGAPTFKGFQILVPSQELVILDGYTGKLEKSIDIYNPISPITTEKDKIFAVERGNVYAFSPKGNRLWRYDTTGALATPPILGYDLVYFASYDRYIYCLDEKGYLYWKTRTPDIIYHPLCLWDDKIIALSQDSWIYALNPLTGSMIWRKKFSDEEFLMPAFCRDFMLLTDLQGGVFALNPQNANIKWVLDFNTVLTTSPVVSPKSFFIGSEDGLIAYDLDHKEKNLYLKGEKIRYILPVGFDLYAASEEKLIKLSPEKL